MLSKAVDQKLIQEMYEAADRLRKYISAIPDLDPKAQRAYEDADKLRTFFATEIR